MGIRVYGLLLIVFLLCSKLDLAGLNRTLIETRSENEGLNKQLAVQEYSPLEVQAMSTVKPVPTCLLALHVFAITSSPA